MLMALLPLAGWAAQDISGYTFTIQKAAIEYSGAAVNVQPTLKNPNVVDALVLDTDYELVFYKDGEALDAAPSDMGDYTVKAHGIGGYDGYTNTEIAFTITKKSLSSASIGDLVYTNCRTSSPSSATYDGEAWEPTATITLTDFTLTDNDYTVTYEGNVNAGTETAKIIFTAKEDGNFSGSVEKKFSIAKAAIPTTLYSAPTPATGLTYTGVAQDLLTEGTKPAAEYGTVMYQVGSEEYSEAVPQGTDVGTYDLKWKIVGGSNYNDVNEASLTSAQISKNTEEKLTIMPILSDKEYDGSAFAADDVRFSIAGRVGDDATKSVTGLTATITSASKNVGTYTVSVTTTSAQIGGVDLTQNYDVEALSITANITQKALTITAGDLSMSKDDTDFPTLPTVVSEDAIEGAIAADLTTIAGAYEYQYANADGEVLYSVNASDVTVPGYDNAVKIVKKSSLTTETLLSNYDITINFGKLKVNGGAFNVMPVVADVEYGDEYTIGYYTNGAIDEDELVFVIDGTEYALADKDNWSLPTARGNYNVTIKEGTAIGTGASEGGTATLLPTSFNITKKHLTLTVADQTVYKNDVAASFLTGLETKEDAYTITEDLVGDDELTLTYSLDEEVVKVESGKITGYQDGKSSSDASIKVVLGDDEVSANYDITGFTAGKLTISSDLSTDLDKTTAEATIATAAANGSEYTVTISGRTLTAGKWNTMVLPFEVTTFQFCEAIDGYAVFNTLKSASAASNSVKFELQLEKIPANTPFLVKPQAAVDFDATSGDPAVKTCKFTGVTFVAYTGEQPTATVDDADFIGTYKDVTIEGGDGISVMQGGSFRDFGSDDSATLPFTAAYLKLNGGSGAPVITVEEIDGSVTAISGITADGVAIEKDGWYNLNGVQLQGAPAQKGIYIRDGKKIVIK